MLAGQWLGAPGGDQNPAGYASRTWGVEWWHRLGHVPLWEPELFGGMPYIGAGHGDIFYPTSFLRLVLPVATVINLNFVLHYILAGLFALYLTLEESRDDPARRVARLGLALGAVGLGFGLAAIQLLPFIQYIPFSPRAQGYHGFEGSTSYAIPWNHVLEFFIKNFVGTRPAGTYWGSNPLKLHSEYLGLPVVALAVLGAGAKDRHRLVLWVWGVGL